MKRLLILCLTLAVAVAADAQQSFDAANKSIKNTHQAATAKLQLSTSISEQRYSRYGESRLLHLMLNLTYSNVGNHPILLDKKSSLIYRKMISRNLKAAAAKKFEYDESSHWISVSAMQAAGFQMDLQITPDKEKETFITLKPGESYSVKTEIILSLYDGTRDTKDDLHPGTYFLQVRVATWFYFADPNEYREQWRNEGYLWSANMTSEPMPLKVEKTW